MSKTKAYRDQHDKILEDLVELEKLSQAAQYSSCVKALGRLAGRVQAHLAMEDKALYPTLVGSTDKSVSQMAKSFQTEMGSLAGVFVGFIGKWKTDAIIQASHAEFKKELGVVCKALRDRIDRENNQLYVAYDKAS